jgi:hypothetical protein
MADGRIQGYVDSKVDLRVKIMDDYSGIPGRACYAQGGQVRQFTIWARRADRESVFYIYVPKSRVDHDLSLKAVCESATDVESGFMVRVPRWESMVTPEGFLIPT